MSRYNSLSDYLKGRFGRKMYKLAVDGGFSCPNRGRVRAAAFFAQAQARATLPSTVRT